MCANKSAPRGEFALIDWIQQQANSDATHLSLGIGDDCAIQPQLAKQDLLTSTDLLIEGLHFNRNWTNMFDLGRKAAAVNISDIAAMGGTPQSIFLGIGKPKEINSENIETFISGFLAESKRFGVTLAGGDTCSSNSELMLSITIQGTIASGTAICRHGARAGDAVYVSGCLGDSALALQIFKQQQQPDQYLTQRFNTPTPQVELGKILATKKLATAMLDVSDGIIADLGHILTASKVGVELELTELPLSQPFKQALVNDESLIDLALAGGEDYELIFTSPLQNLAQQLRPDHKVTKIGTITTELDTIIRHHDGSIYHCRQGGFDHFA